MNILSLFDGISAGRVALERAGIKVDKYYASEIDKYAIKVTMNNYPDTIQLGDVYNIDYSKLENIDFVIGGSPCFTKGNKVLTESGYKNIEDIEVGEFVFTHKKNYKKVTFIGNEKKEIVEIKAQGFLTTETTKEHPFYVREMKRVWDKNKRCYERVFSDPKWKKAIDLTKNDFIGIPILESSENKHNLSNEDCWLLGRYVADGHIRKTKRKDRVNSFQYQVVYSIGDKKVEYFKEKIKNKHFSCYKHTKSTHRIVFSNMDLLEFIKNNNFGEVALNKNIPKFILDLPVNLLKEFLEGYFSGDGYEKDGVVYATTISKDLAIGICLAVAKVFKVSCGISFNKKPSKHIIEGREVNQKNNYTITFRRERKKQSNFYSDGEFVWNPVKNITVKNEDIVYNITVDEDESYTINNAVVHNCTHWSIAKKDRETTSEGIGFDLFMQFVKAIEKVKPKYFLYENNYSIHKDIKKAISEKLGVQPIMINSALLSAQQRKREYWTNIPNVTQPQDAKIFLKDILEKEITKNEITESVIYNRYNQSISKDKSFTIGTNPQCLTAKTGQAIVTPVRIGQIGKCGQGDRIYSVQGKSVCLSANGGGRGAKTGLYKIDLPDGDYTIRKLTTVECERLQTFPTWEINLEVELWLDQAKNYVSAVDKNPKLQKLVLNVEKNLPKEFVDFVEKNTNASHLLIKYIAQKNVGMLTQKLTNECTNHKQIELNLNANNVANCMKSQNQELEVPSVHWNVSTNTTQEAIQHNGREGYLQKDRLYITLMNGGKPLKLYGKEIMQLVKDVEKNSLTKMGNNFIYTTLSRLGTKNIEQILIICYFYAKSAIDGYIANQTQKNNLLMNFNCAYTAGISNTQRYKCLGNSWTVDVIAHILKGANIQNI